MVPLASTWSSEMQHPRNTCATFGSACTVSHGASRASWMVVLGGVLSVASFGSSCNLDPVHRAGVNSLLEEREDLYPVESEYHRPGEPCALCHSAAGPADSQF